MIQAYDLVGQWIGRSVGSLTGPVIFDVEISSEGVVGVALLFPDEFGISTVSEIVLTNIIEQPVVNQKIYPVSLVHARILQFSELEELYPDVEHADTAEFNFSIPSGNTWRFTWKTKIGSHGSVELVRKPLDKNSSIVPENSVTSWDDLRGWISDHQFGDYIFRGQTKPRPLQTSFHRSARKILNYYVSKDIPTMQRLITGTSAHLFDLEKPQQLGAFLSLLQHHGFPTPLLDWTYSPYVASWFAFRGVEEAAADGKVRVFALNKKLFSLLNQFQNLTFVPPHFSILETLAIENTRVTPQQGLLTLTNLHNIESYIQDLEASNSQRYLYAFDLCAEDAPRAMNELAMMGITRSTMFPGIESICLDARDRFFNYPVS